MAGMLPGVEMFRRRRNFNNPFHGNSSSYNRPRIEPSVMATTTAAMDETALIARRRLEEKLGYFRPSRLNNSQANEGRGNQTMAGTRNNSDDHHLVSRILGRPWHHFQSINTTSKSKGGQQLCVVCLEDFVKAEKQQRQEVMELACSHKYHSKCLLPWLADHPNCPSCRSPIQVMVN